MSLESYLGEVLAGGHLGKVLRLQRAYSTADFPHQLQLYSGFCNREGEYCLLRLECGETWGKDHPESAKAVKVAEEAEQRIRELALSLGMVVRCGRYLCLQL